MLNKALMLLVSPVVQFQQVFLCFSNVYKGKIEDRKGMGTIYRYLKSIKPYKWQFIRTIIIGIFKFAIPSWLNMFSL
jgi:hypothetical protein